MRNLILMVLLLTGCLSYKPVVPEGEILSRFGKIKEVKKDEVMVEFKCMDGERVAVDWFYFPNHGFKKGDFLKLGK